MPVSGCIKSSFLRLPSILSHLSAKRLPRSVMSSDPKTGTVSTSFAEGVSCGSINGILSYHGCGKVREIGRVRNRNKTFDVK